MWHVPVEYVAARFGSTWYEFIWDEWCQFVAGRQKHRRFDTQPLKRCSFEVREVRGIHVSLNTGRSRRYVRHEGRSQTLFKRFHMVEPNWKREAEEVRRRNLRAPFLAEEAWKAEQRRRKYSVELDEVGFLYRMQRETGGPIKIGFALNVERRRKKIQERFGCRMVVLEMVPGSLADEQRIHKRLDSYRLAYTRENGHEWFEDVEAVRNAFRAIGPGEVFRRARGESRE